MGINSQAELLKILESVADLVEVDQNKETIWLENEDLGEVVEISFTKDSQTDFNIKYTFINETEDTEDLDQDPEIIEYNFGGDSLLEAVNKMDHLFKKKGVKNNLWKVSTEAV